ncbi:WHG domain-containing protein [Streptomyces sp. NRRL F-2799]|uniref:WHG domain-containing protein n=1 Tax=Streptomyces sp. NRRL F-2799 TaxID=1463844 RepID=UPI003B63C193
MPGEKSDAGEGDSPRHCLAHLPTSEERVAATAVITEYVQSIVRDAFPGAADAAALSTTVWALVHGLAFLHLDGKLDTSTPEAVAAQVRASVYALFAAAPGLSQAASASAR